tara:strand:- start:136 stop:303 length:168 start_codon:yes stop_codon:yes gene_type:complete
MSDKKIYGKIARFLWFIYFYYFSVFSSLSSRTMIESWLGLAGIPFLRARIVSQSI